MATPVRMRLRDKERLDRLQGEIMARQGRYVPQQEILSWLLDLGEAEDRHQAEEAVRPMSAREISGLKRLIVRTGIPTGEKEIDTDVATAVR